MCSIRIRDKTQVVTKKQIHVEIRKNFLPWGWSNTGIDFPEMLWYLYPGRPLKWNWQNRALIIALSWHFFWAGVGPHSLLRSLPASTTAWFHGSSALLMACDNLLRSKKGRQYLVVKWQNLKHIGLSQNLDNLYEALAVWHLKQNYLSWSCQRSCQISSDPFPKLYWYK